MKKKWKSIISLLLTASMCFSLLPVTGFAAEATAPPAAAEEGVLPSETPETPAEAPAEVPADTFAQNTAAVNLALHKPVTVSGVEGDYSWIQPAGMTDGTWDNASHDVNARWASAAVTPTAPQWAYVDLGAEKSVESIVLRWEASYATAYTVEYSNDTGADKQWTTIEAVTAGVGGIKTITLPSATAMRYVRMHATATNSAYGVSLWEMEVMGTEPAAATAPVNLAQGKPATASSVEGDGAYPHLAAGGVTDGNWGTMSSTQNVRWSSNTLDATHPQWVYVDLGSVQPIQSIRLRWEACYATTYTLDYSASAGATPENWQTLTTVTNGTGGTATYTNPTSVSARYVRMHGTVKGGSADATSISLWEMQVYNTANIDVGAGWEALAETAWYTGHTSPFTLHTAADLAGLAKLVNEGTTFAGQTVRLDADVDLAGNNWTPIGTSSTADSSGGAINKLFSGVFDGQGHSVSNLDCVWTDTVKVGGLFGGIYSQAQIKNLNVSVQNVKITSTYYTAVAAGLVGCILSGGGMPAGGNLVNCHVVVNGIIGADANTAQVSSHVGALTGVSCTTQVVDCTAEVATGAQIYNHSTANWYYNIGGLIGTVSGKLTMLRSGITIRGTLDGTAGAAITAAYGGLVGRLATSDWPTVISDCYVLVPTGGATTFAAQGGAGKPDDIIMGALCGVIGSQGFTFNIGVTNFYYANEGTETCTADISHGALFGSAIWGGAPIAAANCYTFVASQPTLPLVGRGAANVAQANCGIKTAAELQQKSTFPFFDFTSVWTMDAATHYPRLATEKRWSDAAAKTAFEESCTFDGIRGSNTKSTEIRSNLVLPTVGMSGAAITWTSSNPDVISAAGVVTPPAASTVVTMTGTMPTGTATGTVTVPVTVLPGTTVDWQAFWKTYWAEDTHKTWVTVGDSITQGTGRGTYDVKTYFDYCNDRLNNEMGKDVTFLNPAWRSQPIAIYNAYANDWVNTYKADIVSAYFGMNDPYTTPALYREQLDQYLGQLVPSTENIAKGVPANRVIISIACNYTTNTLYNTNLEVLHQITEDVSNKYRNMGYKVQYVDLFHYLKNLPYGTNGLLGSLQSYMDGPNEGFHPGAEGNYIIAQKLMQEVGLFDENSTLCTIPHNQVNYGRTAPGVALDYSLSSKNLNGAAFTNATATSTGYNTIVGANEYGSMLIVGGEGASGREMRHQELKTFPSLIWETIRMNPTERQKRHVPTAVGNRYNAAYVNAHLDELLTQYHPLYMLYMPEVNEIYHEGYTHTAQKVTDYGTQLRQIADKCAAKNIPLTLMTPAPTNNATKNTYLQAYAAEVIAVAEEKHLSLCNVFSVLKPSAETAKIARNWYSTDGQPSYIGQLEIAKIYLKQMGMNNSITGRSYTTTGAAQDDYFVLAPKYADATGAQVNVNMAGVLADASYAIASPTAANFAVEKLTREGVSSAITPTFASNTLSFPTAGIGVTDSIRVKVVNGATTMLAPFTSADITGASANALGGGVGITGAAMVGTTLRANVAKVTPSGATYSYAWYRQDTAAAVSTTASYTLTAADIGKTITLKVTGTGAYTGVLVSAPTAAVTEVRLPEWSATADTAWYTANTGAASYTISTAAQLAGLAQLVNEGTQTFAGKTIKLGDNIQLAGKNWAPIGIHQEPGFGNVSKAFQGTFDGQNFAINGLNVTTSTLAAAGVFGAVSGNAVIKNTKVTVDKVSIARTGVGNLSAGAAGLVGTVLETGAGGSITNCNVVINGTLYTKPVGTGYSSIGGISSVVWPTSFLIQNCFVTLSEGASFNGQADTNCNVNIGGYVGFASCNIDQCKAYVAGSIRKSGTSSTSMDAVGAFLGWAYAPNMKISNSYATFTSTASLTIDTAGVAGQSYYGGLIGNTNASSTTVENSYIVLEKDIPSLQGAIVGNGGAGTHLTNAYYATTSSTLPAAGTASTVTGGGKKTTDEMKQQATFVGFDFNTKWSMPANGYPVLKAEADSAAALAEAKAWLTFDTFRGNNAAQNQIHFAMALPETHTNGTSISWKSSNQYVLSDAGALTATDALEHAVTLTATLRRNGASETKTFDLVVNKSRPQGSNIDWNTYWATAQDKVWLSVGDSISVPSTQFLWGHKTYDEIFRHRINNEMGKNFTFYNTAYSGRSLEDIYNNRETWVKKYDADVVTFYIGMNDSDKPNKDNFKIQLDGLLSELVPSAANVQGGVPQDRVIILMASNNTLPNRDNTTERPYKPHIQAIKDVAKQYQDMGYKVEVLSMYDLFETGISYGTYPNLANAQAYYQDWIHPKQTGHLKIAHTVMERIGLLDAASPASTLNESDVANARVAPYCAPLDYSKAQKKQDNSALSAAAASAAAFTTFLGTNEVKTMLFLGGEMTSGMGGFDDYQTYAEAIGGHIRGLGEGEDRDGHLISTPVVAGSGYSAATIDANLDTLVARHDPKYVMYMPEVNEIYQANYAHTAAKVQDYKTHLTSIVRKLKTKNIPVTLLTPAPTNNAARNAQLADYVTAVIEVAEAESVNVSNVFHVLEDAVKNASVARNWYFSSGYMNGVGQIELAKAFLRGSVGKTAGNTTNFTFRNASTTTGVQRDEFVLLPKYVDSTNTDVVINLAEVLADPLHTGATAFAVEKQNGATVMAVPSTYNAADKTLRFAASAISAEDAVSVKVTKGTTTYLAPFAKADIQAAGVAHSFAELTSAIAAAQTLKNSVVPSANGTDVAASQKWATAANIATFSAAIESAGRITSGAGEAAITKAYNDLAAAKTTFEGQCANGTKALIVVSTPNAALGAVALQKPDGTPIADASTIVKNDLVKLVATPTAGKRFVKWVKKSGGGTPSMDTFAFDGAQAEYTANPLILRADVAVALEAEFAALEVVAADAPMLQMLRATTNGTNPMRAANKIVSLIGADGTEGFRSGASKTHVASYDAYLLTGETALNLTPIFDAAAYNVTIDAAAATNGTLKTIPVTDQQVVTIAVTSIAAPITTTTYKITAHVAAKNPKIKVELNEDMDNPAKVTGTVMVSDTDFTAAQVQLQITGTDGFTGFTNAAGTALADGKQAAGVGFTLNPELAALLTVSEVTYDTATKTFSVGVDTNGGASIPVVEGTPLTIGTLYLSKAANTKLSDASAGMKPTAAANGANTLMDRNVRGVRDDGLNQEATSLVYTKAVLRQDVTLYSFISGVPGMNRARITFNVHRVTNGVVSETPVNPSALSVLADGTLRHTVPAGTYVVKVYAGGYLAHVSERISATELENYFDSCTLVAGDINNDTRINTDDRTALLTVFNKAATGGAAQNDASVSVFADFDDDGHVNAIDLGRLLLNYTK